MTTIEDLVEDVAWDKTLLDQDHEPNAGERLVKFFTLPAPVSLPLQLPEYSWFRNVLTLLWHTKMPVVVDLDGDVVRDLRMEAVDDQVRHLSDPLADGTIRVFLGDSPRLFYIRRGASADLVQFISGSLGRRVLVVARDDGEIVRAGPSVRLLAQSGPSAPAVCSVDHKSLTNVEQRTPDLFAAVSAMNCDLPALPNASATCVPFLLPDTGCWVRAHMMCELLRSAPHEVEAGKVWAYGFLEAGSKNHPNCKVDWNYHAAPVVRVGEGPSDLMVLDPSLFSEAVPLNTWLGKLGTVQNFVVTDRHVYRQSEICVGVKENGLLKNDLMYLHALLLARARGRVEPPPFSCP